MTESEIQRKADLIVKALKRREIPDYMGALREMTDNQLRLLYNQLSSDQPRQIRFLLRQGISAGEIVKEAERAQQIVTNFHKHYAPGDIVSSNYDLETASWGKAKKKRRRDGKR